METNELEGAPHSETQPKPNAEIKKLIEQNENLLYLLPEELKTMFTDPQRGFLRAFKDSSDSSSFALLRQLNNVLQNAGWDHSQVRWAEGETHTFLTTTQEKGGTGIDLIDEITAKSAKHISELRSRFHQALKAQNTRQAQSLGRLMQRELAGNFQLTRLQANIIASIAKSMPTDNNLKLLKTAISRLHIEREASKDILETISGNADTSPPLLHKEQDEQKHGAIGPELMKDAREKVEQAKNEFLSSYTNSYGIDGLLVMNRRDLSHLEFFGEFVERAIYPFIVASLLENFPDITERLHSASNPKLKQSIALGLEEALIRLPEIFPYIIAADKAEKEGKSDAIRAIGALWSKDMLGFNPDSIGHEPDHAAMEKAEIRFGVLVPNILAVLGINKNDLAKFFQALSIKNRVIDTAGEYRDKASSNYDFLIKTMKEAIADEFSGKQTSARLFESSRKLPEKIKKAVGEASQEHSWKKWENFEPESSEAHLKITPADIFAYYAVS